MQTTITLKIHTALLRIPRFAPFIAKVVTAVEFRATMAQCRAVLPWKLSWTTVEAPKFTSIRVGSKLKQRHNVTNWLDKPLVPDLISFTPKKTKLICAH